jgi:serine protease AprX
MTTLYVNDHAIEPASQLEGGSHFSPDASQSNFILVQCADRPLPAHYEALATLGVTTVNYIGSNTNICLYKPTDLEAIRALPFVVYANVYHPDFVINASLKAKALQKPTAEQYLVTPGGQSERSSSGTQPAPSESQSGPDQVYDCWVGLHTKSRSLDEIRQELSELLHADPSKIYKDGHLLRMYLRAQDLELVATVDDVRSIQETTKFLIHSFVARKDMGYTDPKLFQTGLGIMPSALDATGETIAMSDTGFDVGDKTKIPAAFGDRILDLIPISRPTKTDDPYGHGTHISGCIVAIGNSTQFPNEEIRGTATGAGLVVQSLAADGSAKTDEEIIHIPPESSITELFVNPYKDWNARIHTNSWGKPKGGKYDEYCEIVDKVVSDHKDLLILFSAGNKGNDPAAGISTPGCAKNCLTIGNCESSQTRDRSLQMYRAWGLADILLSRSVRGDINNVASTSSNGPTAVGRIKPDVVAPGGPIYSTRSHFPNFAWSVDKTGQSNYNAFGISTDPDWIWGSGASQATALVAGCAAVIRQNLRSHLPFGTQITAAFIKALIINGAIDMSKAKPTRGPKIGPPPDNAQGFGRVNLASALLPLNDQKNGGFYQGAALKVDSPPYTREIDIYPAPYPGNVLITLKATLVWSDPENFAGNTVNMLYLSARQGTSPAVQIRYGNTQNSTPDNKNNVQKVIWPGVQVGKAQLWVECAQISGLPPNDKQDFALVWYVEYAQPPDQSPQETSLFLKYAPIVGPAVAVGLVAAYFARKS